MSGTMVCVVVRAKISCRPSFKWVQTVLFLVTGHAAQCRIAESDYLRRHGWHHSSLGAVKYYLIRYLSDGCVIVLLIALLVNWTSGGSKPYHTSQNDTERSDETFTARLEAQLPAQNDHPSRWALAVPAWCSRATLDGRKQALRVPHAGSARAGIVFVREVTHPESVSVRMMASDAHVEVTHRLSWRCQIKSKSDLWRRLLTTFCQLEDVCHPSRALPYWPSPSSLRSSCATRFTRTFIGRIWPLLLQTRNTCSEPHSSSTHSHFMGLADVKQAATCCWSPWTNNLCHFYLIPTHRAQPHHFDLSCLFMLPTREVLQALQPRIFGWLASPPGSQRHIAASSTAATRCRMSRDHLVCSLHFLRHLASRSPRGSGSQRCPHVQWPRLLAQGTRCILECLRTLHAQYRSILLG